MSPDEQATTYDVNLAALATSVGQRLHRADMPVTPHQSVQFARALQLTNLSSRRELYNMARAIFVTDVDQVETFDRVFTEIFGVLTFAGDRDGAVQAAPLAAPVAQT
jgi:uncharacterized protein with von Willebrand factor type A (vWA) domain